MPGQTTRGDMVFTWTETPGAGSALRGDQQAPLVNVPMPPYDGMRRVRPVVEATRDPAPRTAALNKPFEGRDELEIDRNHWKREAIRYKQLLMDMLGKEVE